MSVPLAIGSSSGRRQSPPIGPKPKNLFKKTVCKVVSKSRNDKNRKTIPKNQAKKGHPEKKNGQNSNQAPGSGEPGQTLEGKRLPLGFS
jgi:hypothetical protein